MNKAEVVVKLKGMSNRENAEGMARFGINPDKLLGIPIPPLRRLAKEIRLDPSFAEASAGRHLLALEVWDSGYHEAKILASMIDEVDKVNEEQMDMWAGDFDSWDVCDQTCMNLFAYTSFAVDKAIEWSGREEEFVKRAGFALMACLAWKIKDAPDSLFDPFFPIIKKESIDNRNFVKKAVNWALRQIGKRNRALNKKAINIAQEIMAYSGDLSLSRESDKSRSAKWIASDALRELQGQAVQDRLK